MFIDGIGIAGYRSFGPDIQRIGPFKKINFFIGKNNSGKSNILRFLEQHYMQALNNNLKLADLDQHKGKSEATEIEIGLKIGGAVYEKIRDKTKVGDRGELVMKIVEEIYTSSVLNYQDGMTWMPLTEISKVKLLNKCPSSVDLPTISSLLSCREELIGKSWTSTSDKKTVMKDLLSLLFSANCFRSTIDIIHAFREVKSGSNNDFSGLGLIERLAQLERPSHNKQADRARFDKINLFLKTVTERREAKLEIRHDHKVINVFMNDKFLPLDSLGTGIHEVIIIAAAATVLEDQVLCIEEPELHLHPRLQKQLVRYLSKETNNQYFITTHSAHLLDTPGAAIFHVRLEDGRSIVETASTDGQKSQICDDLGYHASDILQANCVIWVEGPSDRIYLNYWISQADDTLVGGLHYSIMFYGGRLLNHLTVDDDEVTDFIALNKLNRHTAVVMDSDREKKRKMPNATKRRIKKELETNLGFAWITKGREIENYINPDLLENAVVEVHKSVTGLTAKGVYDNCLKKVKRKKKSKKDFEVDKVKVARKVISNNPGLDILDLNDMVKKIVTFIQKSNGINA